MLERATLADEMLLESQSLDVKKAIGRIYIDSKTVEEIEIETKEDAKGEARKNIREWFRKKERPILLTENDIDELIAYI